MAMAGDSPAFLVCARGDDDPGLVPEVLRDLGCKPGHSYRDNRYGPTKFNLSVHFGLIILSDDEADADDEDEYGTEMRWVHDAIKAGRPDLGLCHGSQL